MNETRYAFCDFNLTLPRSKCTNQATLTVAQSLKQIPTPYRTDIQSSTLPVLPQTDGQAGTDCRRSLSRSLPLPDFSKLVFEAWSFLIPHPEFFHSLPMQRPGANAVSKNVARIMTPPSKIMKMTWSFASLPWNP